MPDVKPAGDALPLLISRSHMTTEANKTGAWRIMRPLALEKTAPCSASCPAGADIGRMAMETARGALVEACRAVLTENPFPAVCGRICFHPCEANCNRTAFDAGIAIRPIERFLGDHALRQGITAVEKAPDTGKRTAIIGVGPAGLSAAYFLSGLGIRCDLFETESEAGGLMRWGIPAYRLPTDVLFQEIRRIEDLGISLHLNHRVDPKDLDDIKSDYHALFVGSGLGRPVQLGIPNSHLALDGLGLLHRIRSGELTAFDGTVVVVGGGNTAVDVARSLLRLGASPTIVYRRTKADMPAFKPEVAMAAAEGIPIMEQVAPIRIEKKDRQTSLTLQKMKLHRMGKDGRARVVPDKGHTETLIVDAVVVAIGAEPDPNWDIPGKTDRKDLKSSHGRFFFGDPPILFGGDLTNRNLSVADAIASGKSAALMLDIFLKKGREAIEKTLSSCRVGDGPALSLEIYQGGLRSRRNPHIVSFEEINLDYFRPAARAVPFTFPLNTAPTSFSETEDTFSADPAQAEASRCFNCGLCNACDTCRLFCPDSAMSLRGTERSIDYDYCKGCGICVTECPRSALAMEKEQR